MLLITTLICIIFVKINPVFSRVDIIHPNNKQKFLLHETVKNLFDLDDNMNGRHVWRWNTKSSKAVDKYMKRLFDNYRNDKLGNSELENKIIVRAIIPKIGHFQNREVLFFDLQAIQSSESLLKAEIHYYLGPHSSSNSKTISCYVLELASTSNFKETKIELPLTNNNDQSNDWIVFDATQVFNSTISQRDIDSNEFESVNDTKATGKSKFLAIVFAKSINNRPFRDMSVRKTMRFHAPFLSISSRDHVIALSVDRSTMIDSMDDDQDEGIDDDEISRRKKRDVDTKYYEYHHPYETSFTTSPNDVFDWKSITDQNIDQENIASTIGFVQRGPSILRRTGGNSGKKDRKKSHGRRGIGKRNRDQYLDAGKETDEFGQEYESGKTRKKKYGKILKAKGAERNPTTVVLLEGKDENGIATCQKNDLVINFHDIGWGDYIIAPNSFEANYCAGSCPYPIPTTVNATNHAILLDVLQKIRLQPQIPKPCCAPEKMDSLSLLYYDKNANVVLTTYPKMSVISCACL